ncbi:Carbohydrate esterase 4 protein [Haplosporangium bisporale]|nr:Carbohydrate esterase 4 protein [Haplosporangium bisporale]
MFKPVNAANGVITECTKPNTAALTFDDGPYVYAEDIIKTLNAANAKGTFFVNGNNWDCIYNEDEVLRLKLAYDNGHQIASHTWSHQHLVSLSREQIDSEMSRTEDAIRKITGATPAFTRPPYEDYNDKVIDVANNRNQKLVTWDFDSGDNIGVSPEDQKKRFDDLVAKKPINVLAQMHEVYETTAHKVLPYAIKVLQGAGYKLVTVAECLGENPYLRVDTPSARDSSWHC